jgi:hypothetical protein
MKRSEILPVLAPAFNALLGIAEGFFGRTPRTVSSPGQERAARDLAAHRKKFWAVDTRPEDTRQRRRAAERRTLKIERSARKKAHRKLPGGMAAVR